MDPKIEGSVSYFDFYSCKQSHTTKASIILYGSSSFIGIWKLFYDELQMILDV